MEEEEAEEEDKAEEERAGESASATSEPIRWLHTQTKYATVWVLPVPGGPCTSVTDCCNAAIIASRCEELSAGKLFNSLNALLSSEVLKGFAFACGWSNVSIGEGNATSPSLESKGGSGMERTSLGVALPEEATSSSPGVYAGVAIV